MKREDFWLYVDQSGGPDACWTWLRARSANGYGNGYMAGRTFTSHRLAYELAVGPIPAGLTIDHECFNRICCNPRHLRPMTLAENSARTSRSIADHCHNGHLYDEANTRWQVEDGLRYRVCRVCSREATARYMARQRQRRVA